MEAKKSFIFGPFSLDLADQRLCREKDEIRLTPKAFAALKFLAEHPDRLVTKESLLESLWPGVYVTEAALTVCIGEIRKALGDNPKEPRYIETVHRRGYRFIAPIASDEHTLQQASAASSPPESKVSVPAGSESAPQRQEEPVASSKAAPWGLTKKAAITSIWGKVAIALTALLLVGVGVLFGWNVYHQPLFGLGAVIPTEGPWWSMPEKPAIAVLPFDNLTGDPNQEFFSDGISDDIITRLARIPDLIVIARNSSFTYKDKPVKVQEVGSELNVGYVLEGSVRRAENRVRINARLLDATTGKHMWAESYDRELKDIFAVKDDITLKIIQSLLVKLTHGEASVITASGTNNIKAWEAAVQGRWHYWRLTREGNAEARRLYEKALALDPEFALMHVAIGNTHYQDGRRKYTEDPASSLAKAERFALEALAADDSIASAHALLGNVYLTKGQETKALVEVKRSVDLAPSDPLMLTSLARMLIKVGGNPEEALELAEKAIRIHPHYQAWTHRILVRAYYYAERYDDAASAAQRYIVRDPTRLGIHSILVASLVASGQEKEARTEVNKILEQRPEFSARTPVTVGFFSEVRNEFKDRLVNHLVEAGLPG